MYQNLTLSGATETAAPGIADICVHRNKVKRFNNQVYLKDKQEFEIELFNPSTLTKLAKISINGVPISNAGIVVKPGQRVYLERFIDTPKKFLFETYEVDGSEEAKKAIAKNGDIEVRFYNEIVPVSYGYDTIYTNTPFLSSGTVTASNSFSTTTSCNQFFSKSHTESLSSPKKSKNSETGRVEKGSYSDQEFRNYNGNFNSYPSNTVYIKILPLSQKPVEVRELATYCTNCGTKNRKNRYLFCPKCGTRFSH